MSLSREIETMKFLLLLSLALFAFKVINCHEELTFPQLVQIFNEQLSLKKLKMQQSLNVLIPNKFVKFAEGKPHDEDKVFLSRQEIQLVQNGVPSNLVDGERNIRHELNEYINELNGMIVSIGLRNFAVYHAINLKLPNAYDRKFMEQYKLWNSNMIDQYQVKVIDNDLVASSAYIEWIKFNLQNHLNSVQSLRKAIKQGMNIAKKSIDGICKTTNSEQKKQYFAQVDRLMPTVRDNLRLLYSADDELLTSLNKYNEERTRIAASLFEGSGESR